VTAFEVPASSRLVAGYIFNYAGTVHRRCIECAGTTCVPTVRQVIIVPRVCILQGVFLSCYMDRAGTVQGLSVAKRPTSQTRQLRSKRRNDTICGWKLHVQNMTLLKAVAHVAIKTTASVPQPSQLTAIIALITGLS
jgi:hypothetical protein